MMSDQVGCEIKSSKNKIVIKLCQIGCDIQRSGASEK